MKNIIFRDKRNVELEVFFNTEYKAVITINSDGYPSGYVFDDEDEIDEFIEQLKQVKKDIINLG